jgi:hypothetical protein
MRRSYADRARSVNRAERRQLQTPALHVPLQHPVPLAQASPGGRQQKLTVVENGHTAGGAHGAMGLK